MQVENFEPPFFCDHLDDWARPQVAVYHLSHLKEVEFVGLAATECELWLMRASNTAQLHKVSIGFEPRSGLENRMHAFHRITQLQRHSLSVECVLACLASVIANNRH